MSVHFHVGQKVVCIRGAVKATLAKGGWCPQTGGVYTIRGIYNGPLRVDLILEEYVHDQFHPDGYEVGWQGDRFKPLVERKTDIYIFEAMLTKTRISVPA